MIKNKRLRPYVEKVELDLFWKGEFSIDENEEPKEDAGDTTIIKKDEVETNGSVVATEVVATPYQGTTCPHKAKSFFNQSYLHTP